MRRARTRRRAWLALLLVLLSVSSVPAAEAGTSRDRLSETRRQLRAARSRLYSAKRTDADLLATIGAIARQLGTVRGRLAAARASLAGVEARIAANERRLAKLDARRAAFAKEVGERARMLYIMGPSGADAWFASDTMADFLGRESTLEFAMRSDRQKVEELTRIKYEELRVGRALSRERRLAISARNEVAEHASLVADVLETHQDAEATLAERIRNFQREVAALQAEQNRIISLILARSSVNTGGRVSRAGFVWPVRGAITSPYGPRWGGFHTGIDIDCRTGDRIGAAKAGKVIASEWGGGYGRMIIIDHGNGVTTLYAHMSRLYVSEGGRVEQRQAIGACGATGNATGDHVHFEVRINGQHTNPRRFLP